MRIRFGSSLGSLCVLACVLLQTTAAMVCADTVQITGDTENSATGLGDFRGTLTYEPDPYCQNWGLLTVSLTNTSDPQNGGYITGFLFDINSDDYFARANLVYNPPPTHDFRTCVFWGLCALPGTKPYDAGAAVGGSFAYYPGDPTKGIAVGDTGIFQMKIIASDAADLTAADFYGTNGPHPFDFLVGFRGFNVDCPVDIVPAKTYIPPIVPLPTPIALGTAGLLGLALHRIRFKRSS